MFLYNLAECHYSNGTQPLEQFVIVLMKHLVLLNHTFTVRQHPESLAQDGSGRFLGREGRTEGGREGGRGEGGRGEGGRGEGGTEGGREGGRGEGGRGEGGTEGGRDGGITEGGREGGREGWRKEGKKKGPVTCRRGQFEGSAVRPRVTTDWG